MKFSYTFGTLLFALFFSTTFLLMSCQKEDDEPDSVPCGSFECLNGGTCVNGGCDCPEGFSGPDCGIENEPCNGIECLNGGACVNGACDCPPAYEGEDCGDQTTPSIIRVTAIRVYDIPEENIANSPDENNEDWDSGNGPDIYIVLKRGSNTLGSTGVYENIDTSDDYLFTLDDPFIITSPNSTHTLRLMDEDPGDDEIMTGVTFQPYYSSNGFPEENTHGSMFEWNLEYEW